MRAIELSAPAKNAECGIAAIDCGADAVYIGARKFGARAAAGNERAEIQRLVSYAHRFRAKVYVTLNTILYDRELEEAQKIAHEAYDDGADALILQDMGLLEMELPPIPLFASTQTHNDSWRKVKFLEEAGFQRVILARELSLEEIREIREHTTVDLEFFVAGALCVCYSGQCYFSHAVSGRSANRGECCQPCRMRYSLQDGAGRVIVRDRHLLSLKDLDLSGHLADLIRAGVSLFKIEGRLKDISYVKNMTAFYRKRLDAIIDSSHEFRKVSSGVISFSFTPDPGKTFSRGASRYFLTGRQKDIASLRTPKAIGKEIGTADALRGDSFRVKGDVELHNGDGICFFDTKGVLHGTNVNRVEGDRVYPRDMRRLYSGAIIYRNYDHEFSKAMKRKACERKMPIRMTFGETEDGFLLSAVDDEGSRASYGIRSEKTPARNDASAGAVIRNQLSKLGDSIFSLSDLAINLESAYFIPVRELNEMRRRTISLLEEERDKNYTRKTAVITHSEHPYPQPTMDYRGNVLNKKATAFYTRHGVKSIEEAFEAQRDPRGKIIMTTRYCIRYELGMCPRDAAGKSYPTVKSPLYLVDRHRKFRLDFHCDRCEMRVVFLE
ncbi:MAG: U32 family peptidase [Candidatus Aureabacteria bacterium]|nr:U32 family peptidase [Candidatus Auribacterota bacterium]